MRVLGRKYDVATLIADEVFVVGRNQQEPAPSESSCSAVIGHIKIATLSLLHMDRIAQQCNAFPAFADVQTRPPYEVLQRGRLATLEVFACDVHQCFIAFHPDVRLHLVGREGVGGLHRLQLAAAQRSRYLGHTNMVRQAMFVHRDAFLCQGTNDILLGHAAKVGSCSNENVADAHHLLVGYVNAVAVHPSLGDCNGLVCAKVNQGPIILSRHQLPGSTHQVQSENLPCVKSLLESFGRWSSCAHGDSPSHQAIFLGLHCTHVADHIDGIVELWRHKLLVE